MISDEEDEAAELSPTPRNVTAEIATSRLYSIGLWRETDSVYVRVDERFRDSFELCARRLLGDSSIEWGKCLVFRINRALRNSQFGGSPRPPMLRLRCLGTLGHDRLVALFLIVHSPKYVFYIKLS
ncbi:hypothetical protein EVAR_38563_1 [Eumeta japonica]|uniref:Uncharacterized protein n=1 Tax=Eumeta variegata TaxID=151549 RepID=A0A4C1WVT8_EUMVA|nr:hypothetical protein EVAR_38563_1 [Eumeta japonica]